MPVSVSLTRTAPLEWRLYTLSLSLILSTTSYTLPGSNRATSMHVRPQ
jgi:hypothetical protein